VAACTLGRLFVTCALERRSQFDQPARVLVKRKRLIGEFQPGCSQKGVLGDASLESQAAERGERREDRSWLVIVQAARSVAVVTFGAEEGKQLVEEDPRELGRDAMQEIQGVGWFALNLVVEPPKPGVPLGRELIESRAGQAAQVKPHLDVLHM